MFFYYQHNKVQDYLQLYCTFFSLCRLLTSSPVILNQTWCVELSIYFWMIFHWQKLCISVRIWQLWLYQIEQFWITCREEYQEYIFQWISIKITLLWWVFISKTTIWSAKFRYCFSFYKIFSDQAFATVCYNLCGRKISVWSWRFAFTTSKYCITIFDKRSWFPLCCSWIYS